MLTLETDNRRIYLRYEDLALKGEQEVERLSDWLGLPLSFRKATKDKKVREVHMTSKDIGSSVERWRHELSDEVQNIFSHEIGDELSQLGYSL